SGRMDDLQTLVATDVNLNQRAQGGLTPLMVAAQAGQSHAALFLARHGAEVYDRSDIGRTAPVLAAMQKHLGLALSLIDFAWTGQKRDATSEQFVMIMAI